RKNIRDRLIFCKRYREWTAEDWGAAVVVQTQLNVLAAEGEDAPLSCQLLETKGVLQVTWQRVFGSKERNICSYSEYYGQTVNPDFKDKVQFTEAGLKNSSIVIRKVTEQDEGCYLCLFNIYPDGALIGRTCLNLHEPILDVSRSESPAESVVSCSATGRPAPTVTLTVLQQNLSFSHYNSSKKFHLLSPGWPLTFPILMIVIIGIFLYISYQQRYVYELWTFTLIKSQ
uniref:Ig-like domain-containing protein n=1 Tax=Cyprinodon variegatus TaxID=28743 RepID=A0A3Q2E1X9_CYPVA